MTAFLHDTFTGSGVLGGHTPDIPIGTVTWAGNSSPYEITLGSGYITGTTTTPADSYGGATYDATTEAIDTGVKNATINFLFNPGASIATNALRQTGARVQVSVGGEIFWGEIYCSAGSGTWKIALQTPNGESNVVFSGLTANTDYVCQLTIADDEQSFVVDGLTVSDTATYSNTSSLNVIDIVVGPTRQVGYLTLEALPNAVNATCPKPTINFKSGSRVSSAMPTPAVSLIQYIHIGANVNLPMPTVALRTGQIIATSLPMPTAKVLLNEGVLNTYSAAMPMATVDATLGNGVKASMPMPNVALSVTTTVLAEIEAVMPMPQASMEVTKTELARVTATMPMARMVGYGGSLISATISGFTAHAEVTSGSTSRIAATLPLFEVSMAMTKGETITIAAEMPMLEMGPSGRIRAMMPMGQLTFIGTAVVAVTYEAYAVNLNHKGTDSPVDEITRYTNFPFDRIVRYQNSYFGVAADGLYLLEGTTDHATPATTIPWEFKTHLTDFENPKEKTVVSAYFGGRMGKAETITLYAGEKTTKAYKYKTTRGSTAQNHREKFGRGIKARYFAVGADGADVMELDNIEFNIHSLTRRI